MKKLIIPIILLISIKIAYSGDLYNISLKLKSLPSNTCDLCGCYIGIDNDNRNQLGIHYRVRVFNGTHEYEGIPANESSVREKFNTFELTGRYFVKPKVQVQFTLPFSYNSVETGNYSGIGDLLIIAKYLIAGKTGIQNPAKYSDKLYFGGGFKLPTGGYNKVSEGEVEPHFQTGTGSFDFLMLGTYSGRINNFGFSSDVVYKINTQNPNGYRFANRFNFSTTLLYLFHIGNIAAVTPNSGIYYEYADPDKLNNISDEGSGGKVLFVTGGLNISFRKIFINFDYQKPVYQKFIGYQPENNFRFISSLSYLF